MNKDLLFWARFYSDHPGSCTLTATISIELPLIPPEPSLQPALADQPAPAASNVTSIAEWRKRRAA